MGNTVIATKQTREENYTWITTQQAELL